MSYRLLITSISEKRAEYFVRKYLVEQLGFSAATAQQLLAQLPAVVWEADNQEQLEPIAKALTDFGAQTQINLPGINYCNDHPDQTQIEQLCAKCQQPLCARCQQLTGSFCVKCGDYKKKRQRWRRYRQASFFLLLIIVALVALRIRYQDQRKLDWDRTYNVALVEVLKIKNGKKKPSTTLSQEGREQLVKDLENWFAVEAERVTGSKIKPFRFRILGPAANENPPPLLPTINDGWWYRYQQTNKFMDYFAQQLSSVEPDTNQFDIKLYLYVYHPEESAGYEREHSVGTTRGRFGVIFLPVGKQSSGNIFCTIAHELLHTVGAKDKYDDNHMTIYPDGYFQPEPRYPQQFAEIMSMAVPIAPGKEKDADSLNNSRIGKKTAEEIGWIKE